jgi:hypothetical protein
MGLGVNTTLAWYETQMTQPSRFHNISDAALADMIGQADAFAKAADAELVALKDEAKRRGAELLIGDAFEITIKEQIAGRLDTKAVKAFLGDGYGRFENAVISTVVRIKAVNRLAIAA